MSKLTGVYLIRNLLNGKCYIGSARYIAQRWQQHRANLRRGNHHCAYLQNAWNKYGEGSFEFVVIEELPGTIEKATLIEREQWHIDHTLKSVRYNTCPLARSRQGVPHDEKARANMRAAQAILRADPEKEARRLAGLAEARKRPEWLEKQRATRSTPEYRARRAQLSAAQTNRHDVAAFIRENGHRGFTPEALAKIAESNKRFMASLSPEEARDRFERRNVAAIAARDNPQTRAKMSVAKLGKPSVKRKDPTKCAKGLHPWVEGRRECLECRRLLYRRK